MKNGSCVLVPGAMLSLAVMSAYIYWGWSGIASRGQDSSVLQAVLACTGMAALLAVASLVILGWLYCVLAARAKGKRQQDGPV